MAWYTTGTVALTNGQKLVTGTGTIWSLSTKAGDAFLAPDGNLYEVDYLDAVNPNTKIYLKTNYAGSTASGQSYALIALSTVTISTASLATQVSELLNKWQVREDELTTWQAGSATGGYDINGNAASGSTAGYYPLTDPLGVKSYIACPAKLAGAGGATSGIYTPTAIGVTAISSVTPYESHWQRSSDGGVVTVSGVISVTTSAAGGNRVDISFPVASAITGFNHCAGTGSTNENPNVAAWINGNTTDHRASIYWNSNTPSVSKVLYYTFTYRVV